MKIIIDARLSVQENAAIYFEKAKKIKRKIKGLEDAIKETKKELESSKKEDYKIMQKPQKKRALIIKIRIFEKNGKTTKNKERKKMV